MRPTDSLLRLSQVEAIVGLKKSKLYLLIQEGGFPPPVRLGKRSVRWKASAINNWIENITAPSIKIAEVAQ